MGAPFVRFRFLSYSLTFIPFNSFSIPAHNFYLQLPYTQTLYSFVPFYRTSIYCTPRDVRDYFMHKCAVYPVHCVCETVVTQLHIIAVSQLFKRSTRCSSFSTSPSLFRSLCRLSLTLYASISFHSPPFHQSLCNLFLFADFGT